MAFTIEQLESLEKAIAEGTLKVEYGDKKVEYRSLNEMLRLYELIKGQLGLTNRRRKTLSDFSKGIDGCSTNTNFSIDEHY